VVGRTVLVCLCWVPSSGWLTERRFECSFWNRTKDDADRLGDRAEAKFNRWGDRINESVEDTKHAVQVRPATACSLTPLCVSVHGRSCTCRCRRIAIATASEMQLRWHAPLSASCHRHSVLMQLRWHLPNTVALQHAHCIFTAWFTALQHAHCIFSA
jgi:hypothetical protein